MRVLRHDREAVLVFVVMPFVMAIFSSNLRNLAMDLGGVRIRAAVEVDLRDGMKQAVVAALSDAGIDCLEAGPGSESRLRRGEILAIVRDSADGIAISVDPARATLASLLQFRVVNAISAAAGRRVSTGVGSTERRAPNPYDMALPSFTLMFAFFAMTTTSMAFFREQWFETWRRLAAAPIGRFDVIAGKVLMGTSLVTAQFVVVLALGWLVLGIQLGDRPWALFPIIALVGCVAASFGVVVTALSQTSFRVGAVTALLSLVMAATGGALLPIELMPGWMQTLAPLTPHYWAIQGFRSTIVQGGGLAESALPILMLASFAAAALAAGNRRLRLDKLTVNL
jgi:ABC-2 type transport system permease protein